MKIDDISKETYKVLIITYFIASWLVTMGTILYVEPIDLFIGNILAFVIVHIVWFIACVVLD